MSSLPHSHRPGDAAAEAERIFWSEDATPAERDFAFAIAYGIIPDDVSTVPLTAAERDHLAAVAAYARAFPDPVVNPPVACPHCGAADGFLHADEDGVEFVCRGCFVFELAFTPPAVVGG